MSRQEQLKSPVRSSPEVFAPPMFSSAAWDILLALLSDEQGALTIDGLGALCSIPQARLIHWLADLEQIELITGRTDMQSGEVRAVLTGRGRAQIKHYVVAARRLQLDADQRHPTA